MEYVEGKVYLRHKTTGQTYLWEHHLALNHDFEATVPNPVNGEFSEEQTEDNKNGEGQESGEGNKETEQGTESEGSEEGSK